MTTISRQTVRNRRVFYIPGFDPYPPRRYRELYRRESAAQADISGYEIAIKADQTVDGYGWRVHSNINGALTDSTIEVLVWSDLVRQQMTGGIAATHFQMLKTAWIYLSTGALRRLIWLRKGPVIAALYPVVMLLVQALLSIAIGWIIGTTVANLTFKVLGMAAGAVVAVLAARWLRNQDHRLFAYYLMHDYGFAASLRGQSPPELEDRLVEFGDSIRGALTSDVDEVLVVGHSSGAQHAIHILADILRAAQFTNGSPRLAFLSLGQVVPMVSFLPDAGQLRTDLQLLSVSQRLTWIDISAPGDGCSFALCDPVAVSGVATPEQRWPLVISAAFSQTLSPGRWKALKRRYFRLHFQYLCAFDRPGDYDYFQITSGPLSLADRYASRPPSKSRIDLAASPYTTLAT